MCHGASSYRQCQGTAGAFSTQTQPRTAPVLARPGANATFPHRRAPSTIWHRRGTPRTTCVSGSPRDRKIALAEAGGRARDEGAARRGAAGGRALRHLLGAPQRRRIRAPDAAQQIRGRVVLRVVRRQRHGREHPDHDARGAEHGAARVPRVH